LEVTEVAEAQDRASTVEAFLDAAERLLIRVGYARISTRSLAKEAGANHGLVHYYFGSMEELFVRVLERFTARLIARQRAMYAAEMPFADKWRTAMSYLEADQEAGYQKVWLELQAMAWNRPDLQERLRRVNEEWRSVLTDAFTRAAHDYGVDRDVFPVEAIVSLVMTFNQGIFLERHLGIYDGQSKLLEVIDNLLGRLEGASK
jgi:AcrR family transcriptional regulator